MGQPELVGSVPVQGVGQAVGERGEQPAAELPRLVSQGNLDLSAVRSFPLPADVSGPVQPVQQRRGCRRTEVEDLAEFSGRDRLLRADGLHHESKGTHVRAVQPVQGADPVHIAFGLQGELLQQSEQFQMGSVTCRIFHLFLPAPLPDMTVVFHPWISSMVEIVEGNRDGREDVESETGRGPDKGLESEVLASHPAAAVAHHPLAGRRGGWRADLRQAVFRLQQ